MKHATFIVLILILVAGCNPFAPEPPKFQVKYEVTGSSTLISIFFRDAEGYIRQDILSRELGEPEKIWSRSLEMQAGQELYLKGANGRGWGTAKVSIYKDAQTVKCDSCDGYHCVVSVKSKV